MRHAPPFILLLVGCALGAAAAYLGGSIVTSLAKYSDGDCGTTYVVERVVNGNWFCDARYPVDGPEDGQD